MTQRWAYYNEIDSFAAQWLRNLILCGLIAPGEVDERSIEDVRPDDVNSFCQAHYFAGIGVWSLALRQAGWADDRPIWTGSCPCQPFSAAGQGGGFADERHLWPAFFHLIEQCRPVTVLGEQVASKDGLAWLDLVQADLEGAGYACGAVDTCAAGFGAPHIRQRLYWMANANNKRLEGRREPGRERTAERITGPGCLVSGVADALRDGAQHRPGQGLGAEAALDCRDRGLPGERLWAGIESPSGRLADASSLGRKRRRPNEAGDEHRTLERSERLHDAGWLADANGRDTSAERQQCSREQRQQPQDGGTGNVAGAEGEGWREECPDTGRSLIGDQSQGIAAGFARSGSDMRPSPTNGFWRDPDWLFCRDGKWRPVEPGTFPLAHAGAFRNRVGLLRGAGNAINLAQAQGFVEAVMTCLP